jgi:3-oxoacyl-[acyl-carrier protein] reductase
METPHDPMSIPKVALITGGSRGLGKAMALSLASAGHHVVVNYAHSRAEAEGTVLECQKLGAQAMAVRANVCDHAATAAMVAEIEQVWGSVNVVVHNATGPQPMLALEDYCWDDFQAQLDFFVKAPVLLTQAVLPRMKAAAGGRIILIGSEVVNLGNARFSAYVAAKAAMVGLTRAWASEFGPWGITVNLVAPGWIPVGRHAAAQVSDLAAYAQGVPLLRQGSPADVAAAVTYLASAAAGFVTGQCLSVNGGNTF